MRKLATDEAKELMTAASLSQPQRAVSLVDDGGGGGESSVIARLLLALARQRAGLVGVLLCLPMMTVASLGRADPGVPAGSDPAAVSSVAGVGGAAPLVGGVGSSSNPAAGIPILPPAGTSSILPQPVASPTLMPLAGGLVTTLKAPTGLPGFPGLGPKRDPFMPFEAAVLAVGPPKTELEKIVLKDLKVVAVLSGLRRLRALLVDDKNRSFLIAEKMKIGSEGGWVAKITDNGVLVHEIRINQIGGEDIAQTVLSLPEEKRVEELILNQNVATPAVFVNTPPGSDPSLQAEEELTRFRPNVRSQLPLPTKGMPSYE